MLICDASVLDFAPFWPHFEPQAKRLIGRSWTEPSVQSDKKYFPFEMLEKNGKPHVAAMVSGEKKIFAAEEISAMVLVKMKEISEVFTATSTSLGPFHCLSQHPTTLPPLSCRASRPDMPFVLPLPITDADWRLLSDVATFCDRFLFFRPTSARR